jgi:hypothetical protein
VSRLSIKCGSFDLPHPYGPARPVAGTALLFIIFQWFFNFTSVLSMVDGDYSFSDALQETEEGTK